MSESGGTSIDAVDGPETGAIDVLLVDDNEQWVELLASDLDREDGIRTTTALSANEALMTLAEDDSIECVVADYRMPEVDGIQLLERVREDRPDLPFILLTGMGSEEVASRAIRAGVSDYFRKDPQSDQTAILANRIRQSVEQYRLRAELAESEERYRTIIEQIWDAIVVVDDGRIRLCNERLSELTGYDRESLHGSDLVDRLVHPDDRTAVAEAFEGVDRGDADEPVREVRLVTDADAVVHCEYTVRTVPIGDGDARVASIRDITNRKARERYREREREITRVVQNALVEARTRSAVETRLAELLVEFGYELVWTGETADSSIRPTVIEGPERYVEGLQLSMEGEGTSNEPSVWTARSGEPRFADDFAEMLPTAWRDLALDCGLRTGAALPLRYEDVTYGVLAAYHPEPNYIDEHERELLSRVSDALAFAIHHLDVKKALTSPHVVEVELRLSDTDYYLTELAASAPVDAANVEITVNGTHPYDDDDAVQYVDVDGVDVDTFRAAAADHPEVSEVTAIGDDDPSRLQLSLSCTPPESTLASLGAAVRSTTVTPGNADVRFDLPSREDLGRVTDVIAAEHGSVSVRSCVEAEREVAGSRPLLDAADLTEKQATVLHAAYHHGYFERPRKSSATEIADSLGIVHSTFLQHLRTAQQKLFDGLYAPRDRN
jgi:PAS domain S-box-containing protein